MLKALTKMSNVQNFFENKAQTGEWKSLYDEHNPSSYPFTIRLKKTVEMLNEKISGKEICDLGCGTGALIPHILEKNGKYTGVDFSKEMLSKIKSHQINEINKDKVRLHHLDFNNSELNQKFDVLVGLGFIEYFEDPNKIIKKCNNILNAEGIILLSFPNRLSFDFTMIRTLKFLRFILKKVFNIGRENPRRKMWSSEEAKELFRHGNFEILSVRNYYTNLAVYPFTILFPSLSFKLSKFCEKTFLNKINFFNGGYLMLAKKKNILCE
jgi:2-polyprenyl-3-methyl-5-hydroxy-6-metoxy-1,4-benzoquinol methylase|tara:strand:+ start:3448 stop:4251 length:804 start_codon:yes stop_codon:yes gene_type:complete